MAQAVTVNLLLLLCQQHDPSAQQAAVNQHSVGPASTVTK